jgi:predicted nucleotidyltransferase component of viral defense system
MSNAVKKNLPASVRQRLLMTSQQRGEPFDLVLTQYAIERLLYRLSQSRFADRFLLKGAMLFRIWTENSHRPTRDLDLLGTGPAEADELAAIFREICSTPVEPDGLDFLGDSVKASPIREEAVYGGIRVNTEARLGNVRVHVQTDVGFGDAVTPEPLEIEFPGLLDFPTPRLRSYPLYTVVAEKLEAMVLLGEANSRMKDFYDLWFLSRNFEFDGETLISAICATFGRRKTPLPAQLPTALHDEFAELKSLQWNAFQRKNRLGDTPMLEVIQVIRDFAARPLNDAFHGRPLNSKWTPGAGWSDSTFPNNKP